MMFFMLYSSLFIGFIVFLLITKPQKKFALKSAYKKLTKNKKNFRPTNPNIFGMLVETQVIFLGLII